MNVWKKRLIGVAVILVALAASFAGGYYFHKPDVQIQEKIVEKIVTETVTVEKEVIKEVKVYVKQENVVTHTDTTTTTKPDGTTTTTQHVDTQQQTNQQQTNNTTATHDTNTNTNTNTDIHSDTKITETYSKPSWRVAAKVGVDISSFSWSKIASTGNLTYGGEVDRQIIGPIWVGAWGLTSGQVGVNLSMEW